jgi:hypothetical protein
MNKNSILISAIFLLTLLASCNNSHNWEYKAIYFDASKITSTDKSYLKSEQEFVNSISSTSVIPSDSSLNKLGAEGWEIASSYLEQETVFPNLLAKGESVDGLKENVRPQRLVVIFKRPLK